MVFEQNIQNSSHAPVIKTIFCTLPRHKLKGACTASLPINHYLKIYKPLIKGKQNEQNLHEIYNFALKDM